MQSRFSDEERGYFYDAILYLDSKNEFVSVDKDSNTLTYNEGKIESEEKISGIPTDEELTRCLILLNLIKHYGYEPERIKIEDSFRIGGKNPDGARAVETDIIIKNKQEEIDIICEVKRIHEYNGVDDQSIKNQLFHPYENIIKYNSARYLFFLSLDVPLRRDQFPLNCIGIDTSVSKTYTLWTQQGRMPHLVDVVKPDEQPIIHDIFVKRSGDEENLQRNYKDLNGHFEIGVLRRTWKILWDYIWDGKLEDNKKFENFNKVLLAKIFDERKTKTGTAYQFQRKFKGTVGQTDRELASDVDLLYRKAFLEYLSKDKDIELKDIKGIDFNEFPPHLISKCVEHLCSLSFQKNRYQNVDILGEFYEMVVRVAFKQTKGLFLTHPNIVLFILATLEVENLVGERLRNPDEDIRYRLPFVIDPSCGTGTFLVHYMKYVQKYIEENQNTISAGDDDIADFIKNHLSGINPYRWVIDYVYGIDKEQVLATACQINMILHGDGSTNIYNANGLDSFENYSNLEVTGATNILSPTLKAEKDYYLKNTIDNFDIIISNPPFSVDITETAIQRNFDISKGESEVYFLERWYQLLKPNGRIGVVLPESFFSVGEGIEGRLFLYKHFNIKAIVSLPNHAFSPHTNTSTSLLFATKKTEEEEKRFQKLWEEFLTSFNEKYSRFHAIQSTSKRKISFEPADVDNSKSIRAFLEKVEACLDEEFGQSFVILPYFSDDFLFNADNFSGLKKQIRNAVLDIKDRWVLWNVSRKDKSEFYNLSVSEIGYKAGKKGSKDKPNELMEILDSNGSQIYNVKYAHSWSRINVSNENTALGIIKGLKIWE